MISSLLVRGLIAGAIAGVLAFGFAHTFGEPSVDTAIALEVAGTPTHAHADEGTPAHGHGGGEGEISRATQSGVGLFTGVVAYGMAMGGLLALVFAFAYGRVGAMSPRAVAVALAAVAFVAIVLVPQLKYPANPPAVGHGETIGFRTATFMTMLLLSVLAAAVSAYVRSRLLVPLGAWNASLVAGLVFVFAVTITMIVLPATNEVPEEFPASLLWQFRISALGTQLVLWVSLGLAFGALAERRLAASAR
jgi:lysylphosphatidylglycerol synthetase-like protein (DUF2156 family)